MKSPSAAVQVALADLLVNDPTITAPVTAGLAVPEDFPVIVIGECQEVRQGDVARQFAQVFVTVHAWTREGGMLQCKELGGAIVSAVQNGLPSVEGVRFLTDGVSNVALSGVRYLRDPDPTIAHGVITFAVVVEVLS